jgi:excisionase family DNA binding protein
VAKYVRSIRLTKSETHLNTSGKLHRRTRVEDYPLFLSIDHVMEITGLSKNNSYALIKSDGCPAYKPPGQSKYLIPRDLFLKWTFDPCNRGA